MLRATESLPMPTPDTWLDKYGPIGFVAALALLALYLAVRTYLREATDRQRGLETMLTAQREALDALNTRLVETVQANHSDTLDLLNEQRREADARYQSLLDRHIALSDTARERMGEIASAVSAAMQNWARKSNGNGNGNNKDGHP